MRDKLLKAKYIFFVYILKSQKRKKHYIGCTSNIFKRLKEHNRVKVKSTKLQRPWQVVHTEKYLSRSEAMKREKEIKSYKGGNALKKLLNPGG